MEADLTAEIQIADIAQELERQWEAQEAAHQIRASLFNLILYCPESHRLKDYVKVIIDKFPCRIILVQQNADPSQNYLRVSVSNVVTSKGGESIACDQINIDVTESQLKRVPYIILPHLLADLPIYLLWGQDPATNNDLLSHLQQFATKLIFDSSYAENLGSFSRALLAIMERGKTEISDMEWVATRGWRAILASTFDTQEKIVQLHAAKAVRLFYHSSKIQSMYLQAWLAGQMEWRLMEAAPLALKYHNEAHELVVDLIPREDLEAAPGSILGVEIETYSDMLYAFECKERLPQVVVHISSLQECAMPFMLPLPDRRKSPTFLRDLLYRSAGAHFQKTLTKLADLR